MNPTAPLSDTDRIELLAGAPAPEPVSEDEIEAMYREWAAREVAGLLAEVGVHKDHWYWAA